MKSVIYRPQAQKALRYHRDIADKIMDKIDAYAANPVAFANLTVALKNSSGKRLRIGDFRVLFEESETDIIISDIGPRGDIYKWKGAAP